MVQYMHIDVQNLNTNIIKKKKIKRKQISPS